MRRYFKVLGTRLPWCEFAGDENIQIFGNIFMQKPENTGEVNTN